MEVIDIQGTDDTPNVILDKDKGKFEFSGRSLPEDVNLFYEPILEWIDGYAEAANDSTEVNIKLEYFNTASSKIILDLLLKFEEIVEAGNDVKIIWHYHEEEEDMLEAGEEYADIVDIPFDYISYAD